MTRRRDLTAKRDNPPVFLPRVDLSDVPVKHRVTNATTPSGSLSLIHEWRGCYVHPSRLVAFSLPSRGWA